MAQTTEIGALCFARKPAVTGSTLIKPIFFAIGWPNEPINSAWNPTRPIGQGVVNSEENSLQTIDASMVDSFRAISSGKMIFGAFSQYFEARFWSFFFVGVSSLKQCNQKLQIQILRFSNKKSHLLSPSQCFDTFPVAELRRVREIEREREKERERKTERQRGREREIERNRER